MSRAETEELKEVFDKVRSKTWVGCTVCFLFGEFQISSLSDLVSRRIILQEKAHRVQL